MKMQKTKKTLGAFTLIELLVVIAIIGVLAGLIIGGMGAAKKQQYIKTANAELKFIEDAIAAYKDKYGVYPPASQRSTGDSNRINPLFYELSGVTNFPVGNPNYGKLATLNGSSMIAISVYGSSSQGFGLDGVINFSHGGGEDAKFAEDFLPNLKSIMIGAFKANPLPTDPRILITSVRGPDTAWKPVGVPDVNPFQYVNPGTNNPNSYDLWVELHIGGKTNIIGNWKAK